MKQSQPWWRSAASSIVIISSAAMLSCNSSDNNTTAGNADSTSKNEPASGMTDLKTTGNKPAWAPDITNNMQAVIEKLASYKDPAVESVDAQKARTLHTPTDAVMDLMRENNISAPPPQCDTAGKDIPVPGGSIHARVYTPRNGDSSLPVIVYYHGGGWVIADLNTYDASARGLCEQAGAVVVSVHYRQGPENKFPTAHNDAYAAYLWVLKNAASIKADPARIAVAGESAGGNLACNVSIMARDRGMTVPLYQVLVYPVANSDMNSESYQQYAAAKPLNKPMMEWFAKNYLGDMKQATDPRISLVNASLKNLPPTTIIAAQIDPLMSEGKLLAEKLKEAGVTVKYQLYNGVTHEFFGMATLLKEAKDAQGLAASDLKTALQKK